MLVSFYWESIIIETFVRWMLITVALSLLDELTVWEWSAFREKILTKMDHTACVVWSSEAKLIYGTKFGDLPLELFSPHYDAIKWEWNLVSKEFCIKSIQKLWTHHSVKATMVRSLLKDIELASGLSAVGQLDIITTDWSTTARKVVNKIVGK